MAETTPHPMIKLPSFPGSVSIADSDIGPDQLPIDLEHVSLESILSTRPDTALAQAVQRIQNQADDDEHRRICGFSNFI